MAQPSLIESRTMQIDFFDTMMIERLCNQELVALLPLVSRVLRTPAEAERAVADLLDRMRASAPIPLELAFTATPPVVSVTRHPRDLAVAEGFLVLLNAALGLARSEEQQSFLISAAHLVEDLRRRMIGDRALVVGTFQN